MPFIYEMKCSKCGNGLEWKARIDGDRDIDVRVAPCDTCLQDAIDETLDRVERSYEQD